jgi:hypothetical protein
LGARETVAIRIVWASADRFRRRRA